MSNDAFATTATQCQMRLSSSIGAAVSTLKGKHFISIDQLRYDCIHYVLCVMDMGIMIISLPFNF
jgi:hypothetical protein